MSNRVFTSSDKRIPQESRAAGRLLESPDNQTREEQQASLRRRLPNAGWHPTRFNTPCSDPARPPGNRGPADWHAGL